MQERNVVADLLQIADNVTGEHHGVLLVPGEVRKDGQYLVSHHRVKAAGGLVQQQKLRLMAQRHSQPLLHLHTAGEIPEGLILRQRQPPQIAGVRLRLPVRKNARHHTADLLRVHVLRQSHLVQHHADVLPVQGGHRSVILSVNGDGTAIPPQAVQYQPYGGGLSGAILTNQPHDAPRRQRQLQSPQDKVTSPLRQSVYFQCIHSVSSLWRRHISSNSFSVSRQADAKRRISCIWPSIFFKFSSRSSSVLRSATKHPLPGSV